MEKIDLKDRKILYHLDLDSRQSFRSIGRKVGLSKDVVASRVKRLQEKKIIIRFNTLVDEIKLGFTCLRLYFKYQYITPEIKREIIEHFVNFKHTEIVVENGGCVDLVVFLLAKNVIDIYSFWQKTLGKYRDYFENQIASIYVGENLYPKSFLIDEKDDRINLRSMRGGGLIEYDGLDYKILEILALNARESTVEIAQKLNTTAVTINKRIKKLLDSGAINRFHITIDWEKIGYKWFKANLYLRDYNMIHQITSYIETNPHLAYITKTIGFADLELEFILKNVRQLQDIIEDISIKYSKIIRSYTYQFGSKSHKWTNIIMK